jgi:16S rRNA G966 N2-methylase RsmD
VLDQARSGLKRFRGARRLLHLCGLVEANLDLCVVPEEMSEVVMSEAVEFIRRREAQGATGWDICFYDPPYATEYGPVLNALGKANSNLVRERGIVIAEHYHKNILPDEAGTLRRWRVVKQGDSCLSFYEQA